MENKLALFEDKAIRKTWHNEDWYFSVVDIVSILTDNDYQGGRKYWKTLKMRLNQENNELVTNCYQLKMPAFDGKMRDTDVMDTKQILRIIQSIPSPKAEPFKLWLAQVGAERIEEIQDPELAVKRARETYELKGYSKPWIDNRLLGIRSRNKLTDEWKDRGAIKSDYAVLTNQIYKYGFGYSAKELKNNKGLSPKANIRDHFSDIGLALTNLGEVTAREMHIQNDSQGLDELKEDTKQAGKIMKNARLQIEEKLNKNNIEQKKQ